MEKSIQITFKRKFFAGLIVTIPVVITIFVIVGLFKFVDGILGPFYDFFLGRHIAGLGFISAVIFIFIVGIVSTNVAGKKLLSYLEYVLLHIPVVKSFYTAIKQLVDAFSPESKRSFKRFVIVEYPRPGAYAFGFLTKECVIRSSEMEMPLKAVYIPTNNLYLGEIVLFAETNVIYTDISIEEGIRIILSGGISAPSRIVESLNPALPGNVGIGDIKKAAL